ncbi:MAG: GAF domain-containing protein [Gammaproteobacteria bacterium]|nr:GAF domain-containing protein [Gammaproteobacteria bacterium]
MISATSALLCVLCVLIKGFRLGIIPAQAQNLCLSPATPANIRQAPLTRPAKAKTATLPNILHTARLFLPLSLLGGGLLLCISSALIGPLLPGQSFIAWLLVITALGLAGLRLHRYLFLPLLEMQNALYHFNLGEPGVRVGDGRTGVLQGMATDINSMIEELADLYDDMDNRVAAQTKRLAQKTASLKILYDVANSINQASNLDDLLVRFLRILKEMVNARAATVRLRTTEGQMRLVACLGLDDQVLREREILPIRLCRCGDTLTPGDILCRHDPEQCSAAQERPMFGSEEIEAIEVPMPYHDDLMGFYRLYVPRYGLREREDEMELLKAIGRHLGMAVAKQRSDSEARRLTIIEERTALAHELHDSLAQTLASLRFQVRMLRDTLQSDGDSQQAIEEVGRISNGLDEAHDELRELLNGFRAPVDGRGLGPALEKIISRFRQETGLVVFLQMDCQQPSLSGSEEMQLLRIIQESLANIRKHAHAHTVRVLLRCRRSGQYALLVEDDGVGFDNAQRMGRPGEHIGLSILEERAHRLNGELRIESEPGEGTRIELNFQSKFRQ